MALACWNGFAQCLGLLPTKKEPLWTAGGRGASGVGLPAMWQQRLDPAVELHGQSLQHVTQVGPGLVAVHARRLHHTHHHDIGGVAWTGRWSLVLSRARSAHRIVVRLPRKDIVKGAIVHEKSGR